MAGAPFQLLSDAIMMIAKLTVSLPVLGHAELRGCVPFRGHPLQNKTTLLTDCSCVQAQPAVLPQACFAETVVNAGFLPLV